MPSFPPPISTQPISYAPILSVGAVSSQNVLLLSPQDSDAATLQAGSQIASLPVGNLQNYQPKKVWRSAGTTDYVNVTFAKPVAATMLAINRHNLSSVGVIRIRGAALLANLLATPDIDSGWQSAWPVSGMPLDIDWPAYLSVLRWGNTSAYQFWRVDIADAGAPLTYIQAGRLMLGASWQPSINFDLAGSPLGFDQKDVQTITDFGELFTDRRSKSAARKFALQFTALDRREVLSGIADIQRLRGLWGDVICLLDPAETVDFHRYSMQGVFNTPQVHQIVPQFTGNGVMWTAALSLREIP